MNVLLQGTVFSIPEGLEQQAYHKYYDEWIKPYFSLVYKYPKFKFFFYISGIVFDFLQKNYKESFDLLREFSEKGQIELLQGMFFDSSPFLQPRVAQREQLEKLTHFMDSQHFEKAISQGSWFMPGSYEHNIIVTLRDQEIKFLLIDRAYLEPIPEPYRLAIGEVLGKRVLLFPYDQSYDFSDKENLPTKKLIKNLSVKNKHNVEILFTFYNPSIKKTEYFKNYQLMLDELEQKDIDKITLLPSALLKENSIPRKPSRIRSSPFGFDEYKSFFNYLMTRHESRVLYGYFLYILKKVSNYKKDKERRKSAIAELAKAESHFFYWNFNEDWGIHNGRMRQHSYQTLGSVTEHLVTGKKSSSHKINLLQTDFDSDGKNEIIIESNNMTQVIEGNYGSFILLQKKQRKNKYWNYLSCYIPHMNPKYDVSSFKEIILSQNDSIAEIHKRILSNEDISTYVEYEGLSTNASRSSIIYESSATSPLKVEKQYLFENNGFSIEYRLRRLSQNVTQDELHEESNIDIVFCMELNLSLGKDMQTDVELYVDNNKIIHADHGKFLQKDSLKELSIMNHSAMERVTITSETDTVGMSVFPVAGSDSFANKNYYQYHSFLLYKNFSLSVGSYENLKFSVNFSGVKKVK